QLFAGYHCITLGGERQFFGGSLMRVITGTPHPGRDESGPYAPPIFTRKDGERQPLSYSPAGLERFFTSSSYARVLPNHSPRLPGGRHVFCRSPVPVLGCASGHAALW